MDNGKLSTYLARILSGKYIFTYSNILYKLVYPDINIKYQSELYFQQEYEKYKFNDWITEEELDYFLISIGLIPGNFEQHLKDIDTKIDDCKVDLYNNFLNPSKLKSIRKTLSNYRRSYDFLYYQKHSFDQFTYKGYVNLLKNQYLLVNSLYDNNNKKIFDNMENVDYYLLNNISQHINENHIDIKTFKEIARSEQWRNYWSANKDHIFGSSVIDWTDEQKTLVVLTKMYDSAYENPDCPPDSVIKDDDMFDGWLITQKRESEKNKDKNRAEKLLKDKKLGNAKEVFLVANSKEEAENIYKLNDPTSRHIINERNKIITSANQDLKEADLPDVQRDLQIQNNQKFIQSRKSR